MSTVEKFTLSAGKTAEVSAIAELSAKQEKQPVGSNRETSNRGSGPDSAKSYSSKEARKEDDFVEDLNTPFPGTHKIPCSA